jgi:hypothetical protein
MNLSRLIAILTLISGLMATAHAQEIVTATAANTNDVTPNDKIVAESTIHAEPATESSTIPRRAATANLFAGVSNPFGNTTETSNANGPSPKPQAVDADKWQFQLTPYLWIAGISGRAGIGNLVVDVDAGLTDPNVHLNFGFMGTFEARKDRFIILTDLQYSNLGTDRATPRSLFSSASADFKTFVLDPEVGYRIVDNPEKGAFVDVLGGIRYWHLRTDLTFNAGLLSSFSATRSRGWVDAVAGIRGSAHISKRLFLTGKADLGGGGSKFTYQLFGGVGVLVGKRYALIAGYRDLSVNYNKDGFLFDTSLQGPLVGFGIKF